MTLPLALAAFTLGAVLLYVLDRWLDDGAWRLDDDAPVISSLYEFGRKDLGR